MDVKNFAGMLIALVLTVGLIATGSPGTLALLDVGLIGLLYVLRQRRSGASVNARLTIAASRHRTRAPGR
ncbi:MAG: hypothetical protein ABI885_28700 [Gammaproteobacteria bacterium]